MSTFKIHVDWKREGLQFKGFNEEGTTLDIDGDKQNGTSPMVLLLHAEAACTGIDVLTILEKMHQPISDLRIEVEAEKGDGEFPRIWEKIHVRYLISGEVAPVKAEKAVDLSLDKYCSVSAMLGHAAEITHEIVMK